MSRGRHLVTPVGPQRGGQRVDPEVVGLHRHDLLEVGMHPVAGRRVLVDAAPGRIDELALEAQHVAGDRVGLAVAARARRAGSIPRCRRRGTGARRSSPRRSGRSRRSSRFLSASAERVRGTVCAGVPRRQRGHRRARRRVVDDRLEHGRHLGRVQVPAGAGRSRSRRRRTRSSPAIRSPRSGSPGPAASPGRRGPAM